MSYEIPKYYRYVIIFKAEVEREDPIIKINNLSQLKSNNKGRMHLFGEDLLSILPAIEYCFHMPRTEIDTYDEDTEVLDKAYDTSHDIVIMPTSLWFSMNFSSYITLIIYSDDCSKDMICKIKEHKSELGAVSVSELSQRLLVNQWNELFETRALRGQKKLKDINKQYILTGQKQLLLPALFTARKYEDVECVYYDIYNSANVFETCAKLIWNQVIKHNALMYCKNFPRDDAIELEKRYKDGIEKAKDRAKINVVITMPGIPQKQITYGGLASVLPDDEKKVIRLLGIHRAIAKQALLIELPIVNKELFAKLNALEVNCIQGTNNKYIHKSLRDIGKMLESKFTQEQLWAINRAKHITVFSDFPIGLAIMGNEDTSLQCYKEISYRPLSPLTRCLQNEMVKHPQVYHGSRCKIAFAECIPNDEQNCRIRACSEAIVNSLQKLSAENKKLQVSYSETLTISDLKKFIADNKDADILHLSGHGCYNPRGNMAGLMVGNEFWMANENDYRVPPVVILSACHVSPRGSGTVNVADMFIRAGAEAVLGTFIPINARRNMVLISRLYTYIAEAQKGSTQYKTLSEAWSGVVATNAIHEMAETSKKFKNWIWGTNSAGEIRMMDFTMKRSGKRLSNSTIYADTISILKEMLHDEGLDGKFDDILNHENYFPESFFYQWIGFPENVFLYNEVFAEILEEKLMESCPRKS